MSMRWDDSARLEQEFSDASREWRRIFAEFWGTFLLVFAVASGDVASALNPSEATRLSAGVASGLMVLVAIYFLGSVSGAHLNPAITYAFALRGNFPWRRTWGYVVAQLAGAVVAALLRQRRSAASHFGKRLPSRPCLRSALSTPFLGRLQARGTSARTPASPSAVTILRPGYARRPSPGLR